METTRAAAERAPRRRTVKAPDERRQELLEAARRLFVAEGFAEVTVSRIVGAIGVAQGTFYYHFPSKEAVLEAMLDGYVADLCAAARPVADDPALDPRRALERLVRLELGFDGERARELAGIRGADAHTRLFARALRGFSPIVEVVLRRGVAAAVFRTPAPDLAAEALVLHVHFLFDRDVLGWTVPEYRRRLVAVEALACLLVGAREGTLDFGARGGGNPPWQLAGA